MGWLRVELAILVCTEEILPDLGKHLTYVLISMVGTQGRIVHTLSSNNRSLSSSVLSSVMRRVPLMSLTPPAL
jgi:hypothetical protein